ncbi:MAG TPA: LysR family transcriptional regulator [Candidatus Limiplasma sp.]|nr:LysR family transcriptional regulator [Candidatus Limiplasma sp.]
MTLRHFQIFVTVCDLMNMTAAAETLYMSQPAVSQAIAEMEKHYNARLFDRLSRKLYLTEAGEKLLSYARHIIRMNSEIERSMQSLQTAGTLRIGASVTVGAHLLPELVSAYGQVYPAVRVEVTESNTRLIEEYLLADRLDLGIVEGEISSPELLSLPMQKDELIFVCSPAHRLAACESVDPAELEKETFIIREEGSGTRKTFESVMASHQLSWHASWVCSNADTIRKAVSRNLGVAVLSRFSVADAVAEGTLCAPPLQNIRFERTFQVVYHRNKYLTPAMQQFIDACLKPMRREDIGSNA